MYYVKIMWNTYPDGSPVDTDNVDWDDVHAPMSIYGPFESMVSATLWMENDYPDDDTDVHDMVADSFDVPSDWHVNAPESIYPEIPDEDLRDEDESVPPFPE